MDAYDLAPKTETRWGLTYEMASHTYTTAWFDNIDTVRAAVAHNIDDRAENVRIIVATTVTTYQPVTADEFIKNSTA